MNTNIAPVMQALLAHLTAAVEIGFTATATNGSPILTAVSPASTFGNLIAGLPVFGPGVSRGVTIQSLNAGAGTITLSDAVTQGGAGASFSTGFLSTGRRVLHWSDVAEQPALFVRRIGSIDDAQEDGLVATTLECEVWIYSNAGDDQDVIPDDMLAYLEQLVRLSLAPDTLDQLFTLGGLVYWCRIEGRGDIAPGDQGGQAIARLPVRITLP